MLWVRTFFKNLHFRDRHTFLYTVLKHYIIVMDKSVSIRFSVLTEDAGSFTKLFVADFLGTVVLTFFRLGYAILFFLVFFLLVDRSICFSKRNKFLRSIVLRCFSNIYKTLMLSLENDVYLILRFRSCNAALRSLIACGLRVRFASFLEWCCQLGVFILGNG